MTIILPRDKEDAMVNEAAILLGDPDPNSTIVLAARDWDVIPLGVTDDNGKRWHFQCAMKDGCRRIMVTYEWFGEMMT